MSNIEVLEGKISAVEKYLAILKQYQNCSIDEMKTNITLYGAIERYLYLAVQSSIDLAEVLISYKKFRQPSTMSESFMILRENNIIDGDFAQKLISMVGFRNILAHDYEEIDIEIMHKILNEKLQDILTFVNIIRKHL